MNRARQTQPGPGRLRGTDRTPEYQLQAARYVIDELGHTVPEAYLGALISACVRALIDPRRRKKAA